MRVVVVLAAALMLLGADSAAPREGRDAGARCSARLVSATFGYAVCGRRVLATQDGRAWRSLMPPHIVGWIYDVAFLGPRTAWVATGDCARANWALYRTADGGATWSSTPSPARTAQPDRRFGSRSSTGDTAGS